MKIAVFQFAAGSVISDNFAVIQRAISEAHRSHVRLLVFQECALCGYPPVERENVRDIDFTRMDSCIVEIKALAKQCDMYIALGTVRKSNDTYCYQSGGECYDRRLGQQHIGVSDSSDRCFFAGRTRDSGGGEKPGVPAYLRIRESEEFFQR